MKTDFKYLKRKIRITMRKIQRISKELFRYKQVKIALLAILLIIVIIAIVCFASCGKQSAKADKPAPEIAGATQPVSYQISDVPVIVQDELKAGCEIYACTMLLQYYKFDIDESGFAYNYLITYPVLFSEEGDLYGPDMDAAYAGDVRAGYGINARGLAKCMNNYLKEQKSEYSAKALKDVPLEELCNKYILNDTPVMVWETTYMQEPYVKDTWIVDFVDENSTKKKGDTERWLQNEHCMVLVGYDDTNYYFCDSVAGKLAAYDKKLAEERYADMGKQAIVLE